MLLACLAHPPHGPTLPWTTLLHCLLSPLPLQVAKLVLFGASSGPFNCPLAMTDGAARLCEQQAGTLPALREALCHLRFRDPAQFWTSGQWMTETGGGGVGGGGSTGGCCVTLWGWTLESGGKQLQQSAAGWEGGCRPALGPSGSRHDVSEGSRRPWCLQT